MSSESSSLATAFVWAVSMAAGLGISGHVFHQKPETVTNNMTTAGLVVGVVAFSERKRSL